MSEEKKAVEIKEEELEKVAGGNENFWIDTWINSRSVVGLALMLLEPQIMMMVILMFIVSIVAFMLLNCKWFSEAKPICK